MDTPYGLMALARYLPNGALDATFGAGGMVRVTALERSGIEVLARQPDGRILAAGWGVDERSSNPMPTLARFRQ